MTITFDFTTYLVAGAILVGFLALLVLLIVQRRRARTWRHEFDQLVARHHNLRDAHDELRADYAMLLRDVEAMDDLPAADDEPSAEEVHP